MNGFAATIEIRSGRPRWAVPLILTGLLLGAVAVLVADMPAGLRLFLLLCLAVGAGYELRRMRRGGIAPGVDALWLTPGGDWRLVRDTGELEKAELLHRQGFVTRAVVGLTLRAAGAGAGAAAGAAAGGGGAGRRKRKLRIWLTPAMLGERDWRLLQVRLRNP